LDSSPYSEEHLSLSTQETRILQLVRRGLSVGDIVKQTNDRNLVTATLYALYVMEYVGFILSGQEKPSKTEDRQSKTDLADFQGSKEDLAKDLLAEYLKFRTADYFTLLGVPRDASSEVITTAFKERKAKYHPDRLIGIDRGLVHEKIEELYVRIHNAYRTLANPEARTRYIKQIDDKMPGAPQGRLGKRTDQHQSRQRKSDDTVLFEQGFTCLSEGKVKDAAAFFSEANQVSPKPRYEAYQAWAAYLLNPKENARSAKQTLKTLHKAHNKEALYPYLLGSMSTREKDNKSAIAYFERAVSIDPQHIESARQLRILRMRQRGSEMSTIFQRFKKK
jgi:curved DNA-binding protein CbpA